MTAKEISARFGIPFDEARILGRRVRRRWVIPTLTAYENEFDTMARESEARKKPKAIKPAKVSTHEHWATKLKRELAEERAKVWALVLDPDGELATKTKMLVGMQDGIMKRVWFGSVNEAHTKVLTDGLMGQMQDAKP